MNLSFQSYLALYTYLLFGGAYTILVIGILVLFGYYVAQWVRVGMKLITRNFERRMRSGQMTKSVKKFKKAVKDHFSFKDKKPALVKNGKRVEEAKS
jgi:hypothetical protein